jgi:hypothetical protein
MTLKYYIYRLYYFNQLSTVSPQRTTWDRETKELTVKDVNPDTGGVRIGRDTGIVAGIRERCLRNE